LEGIGFELAPTSHAALVRISFPPAEGNQKLAHVSLLVDAACEDKVSADENMTTLRGFTTKNSGGVPDNWKGMYFTVKAVSAAEHITIAQSSRSCEIGRINKGTLHFRTDRGPILLAMATSFISQEQADLNLKQEVESKSFQEIVQQGRATWSTELKRVSVDAIDDTQLAVFYTNLWKSMLFPRYLQETDKDGLEVHRSPYTGDVRPGKIVADSGFWDSYRTVYQLQSMVFPDNLGSLIDGWVDAYSEAGWLPQWASPGQHASMVGTMGDVTLADAIAKSKWGLLSGFNVSKAYEAIPKGRLRKAKFVRGRGAVRASRFGRICCQGLCVS
jgi:putative alpha-1,2-mannosidase